MGGLKTFDTLIILAPVLLVMVFVLIVHLICL
jgi:hypothetical protein